MARLTLDLVGYNIVYFCSGHIKYKWKFVLCSGQIKGIYKLSLLLLLAHWVVD
jgi:hypothetical protein